MSAAPGDGGRYAGAPFDEDAATIAAYLEDLSVPALMMSMVHMTGDPAVLRGEHRPVGIYLNEVQGFMSPESQAAVRAQALDVILAYRAGGYVRPPAPDDELLAEMMQVLLSEPVPEEYLGLIGEELELDGVDPRAVPWPGASPPGSSDHTHVVVIGAGMSGLLAAIRLGQAGIPYTVVEKNDGVGGTWYENRYPGARVDVGNHFYSYSFAPDDHWSEFFAQPARVAGVLRALPGPLRGGRPRALRHRGPSGHAGTRTAPSGRSRSHPAAPTPPSSPRSSRPTP